MKKNLMTLVMVFSLVALCSCSKVSQSYADKINKAADNDNHYTIEEVKKALGDEAIDTGFGIVVAVKGGLTYEDLEEAWKEDKEIKGLIVTYNIITRKASELLTY